MLLVIYISIFLDYLFGFNISDLLKSLASICSLNVKLQECGIGRSFIQLILAVLNMY